MIMYKTEQNPKKPLRLCVKPKETFAPLRLCVKPKNPLRLCAFA
jgi:hypothetical protein